MDPIRFDSVSRFFANRRVTRRQALAGTGAGLAAGALTAAGFSVAAAQEATPETSAAASGGSPTMLFVQSFQSGDIAPKEGAEDRFTVTLDHGLGQTIYFSDRPDRIVGALPTDRFLANLGFPADNPPNAAIVTKSESGETTISVVELFDPVYDPATATATYDLAVLENWQDSTALGITETPVHPGELGATFGAAHLFIDGLVDCPDTTMTCFHNGEAVGTIANADHDGYCDQGTLACYPCENPTPSYWIDQCNQRFDACAGDCTLWNFCSRDALFGDTWCQHSDSHAWN